MIKIILTLTLLLIASILNGIRAELKEINKKDYEERGRIYTTGD